MKNSKNFDFENSNILKIQKFWKIQKILNPKFWKNQKIWKIENFGKLIQKDFVTHFFKNCEKNSKRFGNLKLSEN